jgi:hypothetical protein
MNASLVINLFLYIYATKLNSRLLTELSHLQR